MYNTNMSNELIYIITVKNDQILKNLMKIIVEYFSKAIDK